MCVFALHLGCKRSTLATPPLFSSFRERGNTTIDVRSHMATQRLTEVGYVTPTRDGISLFLLQASMLPLCVCVCAASTYIIKIRRKETARLHRKGKASLAGSSFDNSGESKK